MALELIKISEFPESVDTKDWFVVGDVNGVAYKLSKANLEAELGIGALMQFGGAIVPTSTPEATGDYFWIATEEGTYTDFGGVVVPAASIAVISRIDGVFTSSITTIPQPENKIPEWEAGTYVQGDQRIHNGQIWSVDVASTTEEPGTGTDWREEIDKIDSKLFSPVFTPSSEKITTSKAIASSLSDVIDFADLMPFELLAGYWHSNGNLIANDLYVSTGKYTVVPGETYSIKGYGDGDPSSTGGPHQDRIRYWDSEGVSTTVNSGKGVTEFTFTVPAGMVEMAIMVEFRPDVGLPPIEDSPFWETFRMVEGTDIDNKIIGIDEINNILENDVLKKTDVAESLIPTDQVDPVSGKAVADFFSDVIEYPEILPFNLLNGYWHSNGSFISDDLYISTEKYPTSGGMVYSARGYQIPTLQSDADRRVRVYTDTGSVVIDIGMDDETTFTMPEGAIEFSFMVYFGGTIPMDAETSPYNDTFKLVEGTEFNNKIIGGGDGSSDSVLDREQVNINRNDIIKHEIETREMFNSLIAIKGGASEEKTISIPGKGQELDNYVQRLHIHHGAQMGDIQFDEVFMNGSCKTDFSDLRFIDEDGNLLDFSIHSHGNYEFIKDNQVLLNNVVQFTSDGKLVMSYSNSGTARNLRISSDNGANWTILHNNVMLLFVDSADRLFVFRHDNYTMYRLLPSEGYSTLHAVLDLSATQSDIRPLSGFCEDGDGNLYCGKYQAAWDVQIFKSTDGGASWVSVFRDQVNNQHVHHISYDPYQNVIYAGLDGAKNYLDPVKRAKNIKSTDGGATWTVVPNPYPNSDYGLAFYGNGYRLGFGETSILGGPTIYKTFDDVNYYPVLNTNQGIRRIVEIDGVLFAGGNAGQAHRNAQVYMSKDEGETWETVFWEDWQDTSSAGDAVRYFSDHQIPMGGTEAQTIIGGNGDYSRLRLFTGGAHFQALVFVKIGSLPSTGRTIKAVTDYMVKYPSKQVQSEINISGLKGKLPLNEGRGRSVLDVVSGELSSGDIRWQGVSRRFDSPYPFSLRDYLPSGIKIGSGIMELPDNFNLPHKNFTVTFFGNFFGDYSASKKFLLGDPDGIHFYYQDTGIYVSNGINDYVCYGLELPLIQDFYNFYALTVTNDATPNFKYTIGDYQSLTRAMTTWANVTSNKTHLLGTDSSNFVTGKMGIHSLRVYNRALSDFEVRQIYFGSDIV